MRGLGIRVVQLNRRGPTNSIMIFPSKLRLVNRADPAERIWVPLFGARVVGLYNNNYDGRRRRCCCWFGAFALNIISEGATGPRYVRRGQGRVLTTTLARAVGRKNCRNSRGRRKRRPIRFASYAVVGALGARTRATHRVARLLSHGPCRVLRFFTLGCR